MLRVGGGLAVLQILWVGGVLFASYLQFLWARCRGIGGEGWGECCVWVGGWQFCRFCGSGVCFMPPACSFCGSGVCISMLGGVERHH